MTLEREAEIWRTAEVPRVCTLLASKVRGVRTQAGESQENFAKRAEIALRTYKRFERDGSGTLETFIRALRAIDRTQYLIGLFPQALPPRSRAALEVQVRSSDALKLLKRAQRVDLPLSKLAHPEED
ncbi:hypothetical protein [Piscinibacter koreensis]|uniref:XRE family transcriptional regulator n=1 Tax=Piscinibacter koreensis TaxID=2742824 RepID=A0A7Y6NTN6_9BURK|nr:hypothetical protein [Schlegelella koreensis]NUZ08992.1 hypothetical protein [Schlegelella koreensis]